MQILELELVIDTKQDYTEVLRHKKQIRLSIIVSFSFNKFDLKERRKNKGKLHKI